MVEAALDTTKPLPWKKIMRGSFWRSGSEVSAVWGKNKRSQVLLCALMVMSLVRTARVGSEEGGVVGM